MKGNRDIQAMENDLLQRLVDKSMTRGELLQKVNRR